MAVEKKSPFTFEGKIDLSGWDIPGMESSVDDARRAFEKTMEKALEEATDKLFEDIGSIEERVKETASEAVRIVFEEDITAGFYTLGEHPEWLSIHMPSLNYGDYMVELDIRAAVKETLLDCCDEKDGYVQTEYEKSILGFAKMFEEMAAELKAAIRPDEGDDD